MFRLAFLSLAGFSEANVMSGVARSAHRSEFFPWPGSLVRSAISPPESANSQANSGPEFCDKRLSFQWGTNEVNKQFSNLAGAGPDKWAITHGIHFSDVLPRSGSRVDVLINALGVYYPHPEIENHLNKEFFTIGINAGSTALLSMKLFTAATTSSVAPAAHNGLLLTFANFVHEPDADGPKWIIVCDTSDIGTSTDDAGNDNSLVLVEAVNQSCSKVSSRVAGPDFDDSDPIKVRALTQDQKRRAVSFWWKNVTAIKFELGASASPKGAQFMIAGQSNIFCPKRAMCNTFVCPRFLKLADNAADVYCAGEQCSLVPDRNGCCVLSMMEECQYSRTFMTARGSLKLNRIGGLGPDPKDETGLDAMVFAHVFPKSNLDVDLQCVATSTYVAHDVNMNGQHGVWGFLNVKEGTSVDLEFRFVKHGTNEQIRTPFSFLFSIMDLDMQSNFGGAEKVTVDGFTGYMLSRTTKVSVGHDAMNRTVFEALGPGTEQDNPFDPARDPKDAKDRAVSLKFPPSSSFKVTFSVSPGYAGRNFAFGGSTDLTCPKAATCVFVECPAGMEHRNISEIIFCDHEDCESQAVNVETCCVAKPLPMCDRSALMPFWVNTMMVNNLHGQGPTRGTQEFITISNVFPWSKQVVDLRISTLGAYTPVNVSQNGFHTNGYFIMNVQSGTQVTLQFSMAPRKPQQTLLDHPFSLTFYDIGMFGEGKGVESVSITSKNYELQQLAPETEVSVSESSDILTFTGTTVDQPYALDSTKRLSPRKAATVSFPGVADTVSVAFTVSENGNPEGHNFYFSGTADLACPETAMCDSFQCPAGYSPVPEVPRAPCGGTVCTAEQDLTVCCAPADFDSTHCGHDRALVFPTNGIDFNNLDGHIPDEPRKMIIGNVFSNGNKHIDLVVKPVGTYEAPAVTDSPNGVEGAVGVINVKANTSAVFEFRLVHRGTLQLVSESEFFPVWFTMLSLATDNKGESRQSVHLAHPYFSKSKTSAATFLDTSPTTWRAQAPYNMVRKTTTTHQYALTDEVKQASVAFLMNQTTWRMTFAVGPGSNPMDFRFTGCSSTVCPSRRLCSEHVCPEGFMHRKLADQRLCRDALCGTAEDTEICCESVGCNFSNTLSFAKSHIWANNLGNKGPLTGPPAVVYSNVFPASGVLIDMKVSVLGKYFPSNPEANGLSGEFGQLNLQDGSSAKFLFEFHQNTTGKLYSVPPFFFTIFDVDHGEGGGGIESVTVSPYDYYQRNEPSEVKKVDDGNATWFVATMPGDIHDNPAHPLVLSDLQLRRTVTFMMPSTDHVQVEFVTGEGFGGRNMLFGGSSSVTCQKRALCVEHSCPNKKANADKLVCAEATCTHTDTANCCEADDPDHVLLRKPKFKGAPPARPSIAKHMPKLR